MAHTPGQGQTFEQAHDGLMADGTTPLTATSSPTYDAETGHSHHATVPTIRSIVAVDTKGVPAAVTTPTPEDLVKNVDGTNVILVSTVDTAVTERGLVNVGAATGLFQVRVAFDQPVYTGTADDIVEGTAVPTTLGELTATDDFTVTASLKSNPTVDRAEVTITTVVRVTDAAEDAKDKILNNEFLVTVQVATITLTVPNPESAGNTIQVPPGADDLPLSVWLSVDANVAYSKADLVNGVIMQGRGNAESSLQAFAVNNYDTPTIRDTVGPDITKWVVEKDDDDSNLVFTVTFDESLGRTGILPQHLNIQSGMLVPGTSAAPNPKDTTAASVGDNEAHTYDITVVPDGDLDEIEVIVSFLDGSVADLEGNHYRQPTKASDIMRGRYDKINPTVNAAAQGTVNADGTVTLRVTFSEELAKDSFTNEDIDRTNSNVLLSDTDPKLATTPEVNTTVWELTATPVPVNAPQVVIVIKAGSIEDTASNPLLQDTIVTWTRSVDTTAPTVAISSSNLAATTTTGDIDSIDGGTITITASDDVGLATGEEVVQGEVTVVNGSMSGTFTKGTTASVKVIPNLGATTVKVTVAKDAVKDVAGNGNVVTSMTFSVGPIFTIEKDTILVITKTAGMTHQYLSDQPRLPINPQPPTPAANIETTIWHNMPDLEVLFSLDGGSNGGTLNLIEAHGQTDPAELPQTRDGGNKQENSVRISEVMWASDLSKRGGLNDEEAAEQWIEISNDTGKEVKIFLYARTGLDSAVNLDDNAEDRVGNAYDGGVGSGSWNIVGEKGQNGNSYTGVDFVSMHRKYTGGDDRGYENGTSAGNWSASGREYLTLPTDNPNDGALYNHKGSPGRRDSIVLDRPSRKAGVTQIPGSKVGNDEKIIINEVSNRVDPRYEWIEIRNVGSDPADLRSFQISMVTALDKDDLFVGFRHNESYKIPVDGVLLLVATDPRYDDNHPLAVGYNIDINENDQVRGLGLNVDDSPRKPATVRYKVFNGQYGNTGWGPNNTGMPDNGEFILIVRSPDEAKGDGDHNHGDKGRAERKTADLDRISDIAGYHPNLVGPDNYPATNPVNLNKTQLWPLVNFNDDMKPHEVNRNNQTNRLEAGKVRYRQHVVTKHANDANRGTPGNRAGTGTIHHDEGTGHYAFHDAGYTGWGYKRDVRNLRVHNGTPGYHGNTVNTKANSSVMISELMYSTGANGTLPQWIELYNSSATKAVHLGSGWRIMIETLDTSGNALSGLLTIHFGSKGRVKYIYPQQTVLVAAGNARQAGSDFQAASVVFPENRVFNVSNEYTGDGALKSDGFANDRYMFFNPKAFHIALLDKDGAVVDALGNLDGDSRTNDTVTADEEFPSAVSEDGVRSSIIRIYDDGTARAGKGEIVPIFVIGEGERMESDDIDPKYSWIPAVNTGTEFKITIKSTWYGDEDDYGTPGHRRGLVLPVQLSSFRPTLEDGVVTVRWTTESELDNAGFNIYRSETRDGEYKQVNTELIDGAGTTGERSNYSWVDQTAKPGVVYYYQIEDVSFAGDREALAVTKLKGLISAKNKLTTTWSELKEASQ